MDEEEGRKMEYDSISKCLDLTLAHELDFMILSKGINYNLKASLPPPLRLSSLFLFVVVFLLTMTQKCSCYVCGPGSF